LSNCRHFEIALSEKTGDRRRKTAFPPSSVIRPRSPVSRRRSPVFPPQRRAANIGIAYIDGVVAGFIGLVVDRRPTIEDGREPPPTTPSCVPDHRSCSPIGFLSEHIEVDFFAFLATISISIGTLAMCGASVKTIRSIQAFPRGIWPDLSARSLMPSGSTLLSPSGPWNPSDS